MGAGAAKQFFANAAIGRNSWWRWVLGVLAIIVIWLGMGIAAALGGCAAISATDIFGLACESGESITGDGFLLVNLALAVIGFAFGILAVWGVARLLHRKSFRQVVTGRASFDLGRYFFGALVALLIGVVVFLGNRFILQTEMTYQAPNWGFLLFSVAALVLVPIQAGFEEVFFRGYVLQGLILLARNKVLVAIVAAIVFALPHLANPEPGEFGIVTYAVALLLSGLFFAVMVLLDGGIELAAGYHAVSNIFTGLVANTEVAAISTPSLFVLSAEGYALFPNVFLDALGLALGLLILNYRYRWVRLPGMGS